MIEEIRRRESCPDFTGIKLFSATKAREREKLGETMTSWMTKNKHLVVVDTLVRQSSDSEFHCVTILLLYIDRREKVAREEALASLSP